MRRLNPAVSLTTALLTAASAAIPNVILGQSPVVGTPAPRMAQAPATPEAPQAIVSSDPMATARSPRHLLRNGQDYLEYGEYTRALALFREAEARIQELTAAEQQQLLQAIEQARQGLRTPRSADEDLASRRPSARSPERTMPGAIALATPPTPTPGPSASPDGVVLTVGERIEHDTPVAPEPIEVDPSVMPSTARMTTTPEPIELPPIEASAPTPAGSPAPSVAPISPTAPAALETPASVPMSQPSTSPAPAAPVQAAAPTAPAPAQAPAIADPVPQAPAPATAPDASAAQAQALASATAPADPAPADPAPAVTLPPLPTDATNPPAGWPTSAMGALPPERLRNPDASPTPPAELPALPPSAEEMMRMGRLGTDPPPSAPESSPPSSSPSELPSARQIVDDGRSDDRPGYRDLLSPEQREEVMMIVRRQEEAEREGLMPAPIDDQGMYGYDQDDLSSSSIQLPRPPSPTEIRPIQSIPVPEQFVPLPTRQFNASRKYWAAAATCHAPLYFQDPVLERYGQSVEQKAGPFGRFLSYPIDDPTQSRQRNQLAQPLFSVALFAAQIATWPYKAIVDPPGEAEYDLGYYRPGDLVPPDLFYVPPHGIGPPLQGRHY